MKLTILLMLFGLQAASAVAEETPFQKIRKAIVTGRMKHADAVASSSEFQALFADKPNQKFLASKRLEDAQRFSLELMKATDIQPARFEMTERQLSLYLGFQLFEIAFVDKSGSLNEKAFGGDGGRLALKATAGQYCVVHIRSKPQEGEVSYARADSDKFKEHEDSTDTVVGLRYGEYKFRCVCGDETHSKVVTCKKKKVEVSFPD